MNYWLLKSEPNAFGIDDLISSPDKTTHWDGIRNYQARNFMRDEMKKGDFAFFYHSSCKVPGVVGIMEVVKEAYPDFTAFDPDAKYFDASSYPENPRWVMVDLKFIKKFDHPVSLEAIKTHPGLSAMRLTQRGNRLSIMPVTAEEWQIIINLE